MALEAHGVGLVVQIRGRERTLLERISLQIAAGEIVGLTGPSGSGKTTLVRLLAGLDDRSGGTISLDGRPIGPADLPHYRCRVGVLPQSVQLGSCTPGELVERALRYRSRVGTQGLDDRMQAELKALLLPLDALQRPFSRLSGGESRRVLLALLLAFEPSYLLLDEPSAGLDREAERALSVRLLEAAAKGVGVLLVTHQELLLARVAQRILILYDGELQAEGPTQEILPAALRELERRP